MLHALKLWVDPFTVYPISAFQLFRPPSVRRFLLSTFCFSRFVPWSVISSPLSAFPPTGLHLPSPAMAKKESANPPPRQGPTRVLKDEAKRAWESSVGLGTRSLLASSQ
jgi:hypothetical protein